MHCWVSIIPNAVSILCFVDLTPFCYRFIWPLSVAGHGVGNYLLTASDVSPGHVANWLFFIALRKVDFGGQNKHWCRYLMRSSFEDI